MISGASAMGARRWQDGLTQRTHTQVECSRSCDRVGCEGSICMARERSMPKSKRSPPPAVHTWKVYKIERLGLVQAASEKEAVEIASKEYQIPDYDKRRIV